MQTVRVTVSGHNIHCWTNYSGFDPEVSTRRKMDVATNRYNQLTPGVDYSAYPKSRSIVFGMNLSF